MRRPALALAALIFTAADGPGEAADADGCKDHPLFNRMPNTYIADCEKSQFDLKRFPTGPLVEGKDSMVATKNEDVEGPYQYLRYYLNEGAPKPSDLQIMRNFENAAKAGGGTVVGEYLDWCKGMLDQSLKIGNNCMNYGATLKFVRNGREFWAYVQPSDGQYELVVSEREAMKQDIVANELLDKLNKDGFVALYINFDTGKAVIKDDSKGLVDQIVAMMKASPELKIEVDGHTDNAGNEKSNQDLSEARAKSVMAALTEKGIDAKRLTAKGFGQSQPVADNRSEGGRAKNRRVELVKK